MYEWIHHVRFATDLGLTDDVDSTLSDRTWDTLGEHLDDRQRMDLVFTIGGYCLVAMAFNTFGIEPEQEG